MRQKQSSRSVSDLRTWPARVSVGVSAQAPASDPASERPEKPQGSKILIHSRFTYEEGGTHGVSRGLLDSLTGHQSRNYSPDPLLILREFSVWFSFSTARTDPRKEPL